MLLEVYFKTAVAAIILAPAKVARLAPASHKTLSSKRSCCGLPYGGKDGFQPFFLFFLQRGQRGGGAAESREPTSHKLSCC